MRIAILSPLFPPDVAIPAPYVKELATRLAREHEVHVLTYNHVPETIPGVVITNVEKQQRLPLRLFRFAKALWRLIDDVDIIIVENGISTELPALIMSFFCNKPLLIETSDPKALKQNEHSYLKCLIHILLCKRSDCFSGKITTLELTRPEIFSFREYPTVAFLAYETAWKMHLTQVNLHIKTAYDNAH